MLQSVFCLRTVHTHSLFDSGSRTRAAECHLPEYRTHSLEVEFAKTAWNTQRSPSWESRKLPPSVLSESAVGEFHSIDGDSALSSLDFPDLRMEENTAVGPFGPQRAQPPVSGLVDSRRRGGDQRSRSGDRTDDKPPAWWAGAQSAMIDAQRIQLNETLTARLAPMEATLATHTASIASMRREITENAASLSALRTEFNTLQTRSESGSSNGVSSRMSGAFTRATWNPSFIEIKGWVTDWKNYEQRGRQMLTQSQVNDILNEIVLSPIVASTSAEGRVDTPRTQEENDGRTFGYSRIRIFFTMGTDSRILWDMRHRLLAAVHNGTSKTLTEVAKQATEAQGSIKVIVEAAPHKQPHVNCAGKFQNIFRRHVNAALGIIVRAELGPPTTHFWGKLPNDTTNGKVIAVFNPATNYEILPALAVLDPAINTAQLQADLRAE